MSNPEKAGHERSSGGKIMVITGLALTAFAGIVKFVPDPEVLAGPALLAGGTLLVVGGLDWLLPSDNSGNNDRVE